MCREIEMMAALRGRARRPRRGSAALEIARRTRRAEERRRLGVET